MIGRLVSRIVGIILVLVIAAILIYPWVMPPITPLMLVGLVQGGKLDRHTVPLASISAELPRALVASEDGKFCQHSGVSWGATPDVPGGAGFPGNAESITMLLAQSLFLWRGHDPVVRVLEVGLAYPIDLVWPKRRIMEVYLNTAEWGPGIFGADAAATAFFGKSAAQLTRREAALLVAVLPDPLQGSPAQPNLYIDGRANRILSKIEAARFDYSCLP